MSANLESAKSKLAVGVPPFPYEDLPSARDESVWTEIRGTYGLSLPELSALKNARCGQTQSGAPGVGGSTATAAGPLSFAAPLLPPDIIQFKIISIDGTRLSLAGLGFRNFIANRCREIGLCGYVWRVPITDAMILASGTPEQIEVLKAAIRTLEQNFYFTSFIVVPPERPVVSSKFAVLPSTYRRVVTGLYSNRELDDVASRSSADTPVHISPANF